MASSQWRSISFSAVPPELPQPPMQRSECATRGTLCNHRGVYSEPAGGLSYPDADDSSARTNCASAIEVTTKRLRAPCVTIPELGRGCGWLTSTTRAIYRNIQAKSETVVGMLSGTVRLPKTSSYCPAGRARLCNRLWGCGSRLYIQLPLARWRKSGWLCAGCFHRAGSRRLR